MSVIVSSEWKMEQWVRIQLLTAEESSAAFVEIAAQTAKGIYLMALHYRHLEELGKLPESLRGSRMIGWLRRIAANQLLPEFYAAMGGEQKLLTCVASMPIPDQEKIVRHHFEVAYASLSNDGEVSSRPVSLTDLTPSGIRQIFSDNGIRSPEAQISWLRTQEPVIVHKSPEPPSYLVRGHTLEVFKPTRFSKKQLLDICETL